MIYLFDGALGTMLQQRGLKPGECPELWNVEHQEKVSEIHREYVLAGADIIETNTFGANRIKLAHYGLENKVALLNTASVKAARAAANSQTKIAGSVGPTGKLIAPLGDLSFDAAYEAFLEQITALDAAGVDLILIETIMDIQEMRAALLAAKAVSKKPVFCQLTFGEDGRTVTGTDAVSAAITLEALGASVVGANCSLGPAQLLPVVETLAATLSIPISVQPNAGMPRLENGQTIFPMQAAELGAWLPKLAAAGASYLGGCCGTTPAHIKAMRQSLEGLGTVDVKPSKTKMPCALTSRSKAVFLGPEFCPVIIGERINPTGRKKMAAEIKAGSFDFVKQEALAQLAAGAGILDVNMGVPGIDEPAVMAKAVVELSMLVDAPLAVDTTNPEALAAALKIYPGRALINSVSFEKKRLEAFLPLAKKYGAAVLCLPLSDAGVPETAAERIEVMGQIIKTALAAGLREQDFLLDPLVMAVSAQSAAAQETLNTLKLYRQEFGYPAVMGLSNVSFGLPRRDLINAAFCAMAFSIGLDAPILNPFDKLMQDIWQSALVLGGHDQQGLAYSQKYINLTTPAPTAAEIAPENILAQIRKAVVTGQTSGVMPLVKKALAENHSPMEIAEEGLTLAMNEIGVDFAAKRCFLPQVMMAAETMRFAFQAIKETLPAHIEKQKGKVVLATVAGDIHDLGKNIVSALLENNGFQVIDLGKDVPAANIVAAALEHNCDLVGLCALMTTTLPQIDVTITALKEAGARAQIIVGGAVVTEDYARAACADAYASDAVKALELAKKFVGV
ncbi:MAG: homocysteine S-methyltransferase family protein [Sporomusaceae bacterium]|jgi:5-methyltetrahydrofolate--homocysteine methyltransferase|nr:homocysteine S-methyltransferase family protein [Sporomusaceae bacterium]